MEHARKAQIWPKAARSGRITHKDRSVVANLRNVSSAAGEPDQPTCGRPECRRVGADIGSRTLLQQRSPQLCERRRRRLRRDVGKLGGAKSAHSRLRALSQLVILACESRHRNAERLWVSDGQENELCARECAPTVSKIIGRGGMQNYPRFLAPSAASPRAADEAAGACRSCMSQRSRHQQHSQEP